MKAQLESPITDVRAGAETALRNIKDIDWRRVRFSSSLTNTIRGSVVLGGALLSSCGAQSWSGGSPRQSLRSW